MPYNPFQKPFGEPLHASDLQELLTQEVSEGYYVEFKREKQRNDKIAKSIASFANTYGGWYIVGVVTDEHNTATSIPGFDPMSWHDPISTIREIAKSHIDPTPTFFPQVIRLNSNNLVLTVYVPSNQESPFITRDGRVYRRAQDSSSPIPESNRYAFDQLIERGKEASRRFRNFCQDDRIFCNFEKGGWLKIYISPYPFKLIERPEVISSEGIERLLELGNQPISIPLSAGESPITTTLNFNAAYPTPVSALLRYTDIHHEPFNTPSIEFDIHGRAKMSIPLSVIPSDNFNPSRLRSNKVRREMLKRLNTGDEGNFHLLNFFDVGANWLTVAGFVNLYTEWLGNQNSSTGFQVSLELDQVWRHVPFCDLDSWGEHVEKFGLPVLMKDQILYPPIKGETFFVEAEEKSSLWMKLCLEACLAYGLPREFFANNFISIISEAIERESNTLP